MSTERTFRAGDDSFHELIDLVPVFIWIADPEGRCMYCNRARLEFTGRTMEQEMGDGWNERVHPDDLDDRMTVYKSVVAARREFKIEYRLRRHDGEYRWLFAHGVPRVAETGELLGYVGSCIDITQRRRAIEALRAAENRYRALFEHTPCSVWAVDPVNGGFFDFNEAAHRSLGYTRAEFSNLTIPDIEARETRDQISAHIQRIVETGYDEFEGEHKTKSGEIRNVFVRVHRLELEGRACLQSILLDITDRKRAEKEVQVRVRQQGAVADLGRAALAGTDMDGLFDQACHRVAEALDVEYAKVLELLPDRRRLRLRSGVGWREGLVGTATVDAGVRSQAGFTLLSSKPVIVEHLRTETRFHGPPLLIEHGVVSGISVAIDGSERPFGVIGAHTSRQRRFTHEDIDFLQAVAHVLAETQRSRRAEQELRDNEQRLKLALQAARMGTWDWDIVADRVVQSAEAGALFGLPPGESFADFESFLAAVHPGDRESMVQTVRHTVDKGTEHASEFRVVWPDGSVHWIADRGQVFRDASGKAVRLAGVAMDITARKAAEGQARQHHAELAHVARVSTMGEMASGLGHELNQPLTAVVNYAQGALRRLRSGGGADEEVLNALERATEQAHRAAEIIRRLANFVQKHEPRRSSCNLNDAVREVVSFLEGDAREQGVRIGLDLSVDLPGLLADNIQVQQVILNLVRNGIEAMSEVRAAERVLGIRTSVAGDAVEVAVRDHGPGLTPDMQERIFTPFYTTKPRGMGMGLSISRSIIDAHGGRLWAASNPDRGSTFHFTLPFSAGAPDDEHRSDRLHRG